MTVTDIEQRWKLIDQTGNDSYNSLRISSDCIPDLFIALDIKGLRFMMLKVPEGVNVQCRNVEMENLTLAWYNATRFILIGLLNDHYEDLFNDLLLSLYTRIKEMPDPSDYTEAFIGSFHRWAEFFDETASASLSEETVKGIFGELIVLKSYIDDADNARLNQVLNAWEGPYDRAHDFYFPGLNVEVKTKESDHVAVRITSEHQLQPEPGKQLQLAVVDIKRSVEGIDLNTLVTEIKTGLIKRGADVAVLLKALAKAGLRGN
ncbi:MAG TPA: PD-(D/E)XK motif protein, partial [Chitinophagaceae bacterium]|nr:PD-(D/E)XK motif protein [Chitinophagaceae bacterium]